MLLLAEPLPPSPLASAELVTVHLVGCLPDRRSGLLALGTARSRQGVHSISTVSSPAIGADGITHRGRS
jgi:hypothetical protein